MKRHILERFCDQDRMGVFGRLILASGKEVYTVEPAWRDNEPFESCVPAGDYLLVDYDSPKFGQTLALKNHDLDVGVYKGDAKRFACLLHVANVASELDGCIAPGLSLSYIKNFWAVSHSAKAYGQAMNEVAGGDQLSIIWKSHP